MYFLNNLVNPESGERLTLLYYLLSFVSTMLVTYIAIAATGSTLSLYFNRKGMKRGNRVYRRFARNLIDVAVPGKGVVAALAGLPIVTIILIYAELLYNTNADITNFITASAVLIVVGLMFLLAYRYGFRLEGFVEAYKKLTPSQKTEIGDASAVDLDAMEISAHQTRRRAGMFGAAMLWLGMWVFLGGSNLALDSQAWPKHAGALAVIFSWTTIWSFIHFVTAAVVIESAAILFFFFIWDGGLGVSNDEEYAAYVKRFAINAGLLFAIAQPLLILVDLTLIPSAARDGAVFGLAGLMLLVVFILVHFFYAMLKERKVRFGSYAFIGVVVMVGAWMTAQGFSFSKSNEAHYQLMAGSYDKMLSELPEVQTAEISGEQIYKQTCSACHRFDTRLVGPPYNMVLPGYVGKEERLEQFINSPTNILKGYPPMPKQGLNSTQVHAVAEYIMNYYLAEKKNGKAGYTE
ncbi:MAG: cytochrome c [Bacteroidetes bacterium]|nr:cytochrome c [Bacteroidota bacterium]